MHSPFCYKRLLQNYKKSIVFESMIKKTVLEVLICLLAKCTTTFWQISYKHPLHLVGTSFDTWQYDVSLRMKNKNFLAQYHFFACMQAIIHLPLKVFVKKSLQIQLVKEPERALIVGKNEKWAYCRGASLCSFYLVACTGCFAALDIS